MKLTNNNLNEKSKYITLDELLESAEHIKYDDEFPSRPRSDAKSAYSQKFVENFCAYSSYGEEWPEPDDPIVKRYENFI